MRFHGRSFDETVRVGHDPKSHTTLAFSSYDGDDPREWHRLRTAASILGRRLRESLREDLGATYGVSAGYSRRTLGPDTGRIGIRFGCDPARADELVAETLRIVNELREAGPTVEELGKEHEIQTRELETRQEQNGYWLGGLQSLWERGRPFAEMNGRQDRIDSLNLDDLSRVFRESFRTDAVLRVTWSPEDDPLGD